MHVGRRRGDGGVGGHVTFLVLGQAEVAVPAGNEHHVIGQVLALDLELLHDDDVGLEDVEHGAEGALLAPWLVAKGVADAVHVPCGDAHGSIAARAPCSPLCAVRVVRAQRLRGRGRGRRRRQRQRQRRGRDGSGRAHDVTGAGPSPTIGRGRVPLVLGRDGHSRCPKAAKLV